MTEFKPLAKTVTLESKFGNITWGDGKSFVLFAGPDIIEDDGIGLIKAAEHVKTGHKSLGTSTIKNILEINSKLTGKKQKVTMVDKSTLDPSSNGTLITIELDQ